MKKNEKKNKKQQQQQKLKISSFYTCVPQMAIIWSMVPEIPRATARIFCHFEPFFSPFTRLTTQKSKIFEKLKKRLEILSFYTCLPQWQLYDVWFLRSWNYAEIWSAKDNLFVILGYFLPFYPIKNPKNQTFENLENYFTRV